MKPTKPQPPRNLVLKEWQQPPRPAIRLPDEHEPEPEALAATTCLGLLVLGLALGLVLRGCW